MSNLLSQNHVLRELFESRMATSSRGEKFPITANISLEFAEALYKTVLDIKPKLTVEIGMAFGISSLTILTALSSIGNEGRLISIDPFQSTVWHGCGITSVDRSALNEKHTLLENFDYLVLPELCKNSERIDFAYIDGWHTFDYVLLNFWFIDKMLNVNGIVGFNDCHLTAVTKTINFVLSHRKYEEIDVGLSIRYSDYTPFREVKRLLTGKSRNVFYKQAQDRYFRKVEDYEPDWDFYAEF